MILIVVLIVHAWRWVRPYGAPQRIGWDPFEELAEIFNPSLWVEVDATPLHAAPVTGLWGLAGPPMQSLMTRRVSGTDQGQLQGALSSIRGIAFMLGPVLFTNMFAAFIGPMRAWRVPGAPYLLAALMLMAATMVAWHATLRQRGEEAPGLRAAAEEA